MTKADAHDARHARAKDFADRNRLVAVERETASGRLTLRDFVAPWLEAFAEEELTLAERTRTRESTTRPSLETLIDLAANQERPIDDETDRPVRDGSRRRRQDRLLDDGADADPGPVDGPEHRRRRRENLR